MVRSKRVRTPFYLVLAMVLFTVFCVPARAETVVPGTARDFYLRGCRFFEEGEYAKAELEFTNALSLEPDMQDARLKRGICRLNLGETVKAMDDFSALIERNPRDFRACYWRAAARRKLGDIKGALVDLQSALKENPDYILAWELRGEIYFAKGDYQAALAAYGEAVNRGGGTDDLYRKALAEFRLGMYDAVISDCNAVLKTLPDYFPAFYLRGDAKKMKGDYRGAEEDYTAGMLKDAWKDNPHPMLKKGLVKILMCRFSEAVADLRTAASDLGRSRPRCLVHLSCALLLAGRETEARRVIADARRSIADIVGKADYDTKWNVLAGYILGERSEKDVVNAVVADIDDMEFASIAYYTIGVRNLAVGRKDRALECFSRSTELGSPAFPVTLQAKKMYDEVVSGRMACPPVEKKPKTAPSPANSR